MSIRQQGGVFGRNPKFNDVEVDGVLTVDQIAEKTGAAGISLDGVTLKDGNVVLASGKGIDFSATAGTGTSELFDDYEEGTWTPVLSDASSGGNTATLAVAAGVYTKIGNVVTISMGAYDINTSGMTTGNVLFIQGLPFTPKAGTNGAGGCILDRIGTTGSYVNPYVDQYTTTIRLAFSSTNAGTQDGFITVSNVGSTGSDIQSLSLTYRVA